MMNDEYAIEKAQMQEDIYFLFMRARNAGNLSLSDRDFGESSNSIVDIAYNARKLENQILPNDHSDLIACIRMYRKLPVHRKTENVIIAFNRALSAVPCHGNKYNFAFVDDIDNFIGEEK